MERHAAILWIKAQLTKWDEAGFHPVALMVGPRVFDDRTTIPEGISGIPLTMEPYAGDEDVYGFAREFFEKIKPPGWLENWQEHWGNGKAKAED